MFIWTLDDSFVLRKDLIGDFVLVHPNETMISLKKEKPVMETEEKTLRLGRMRLTLEILKDIAGRSWHSGCHVKLYHPETTTDWDKEVVDYIAMSLTCLSPIKEPMLFRATLWSQSWNSMRNRKSITPSR